MNGVTKLFLFTLNLGMKIFERHYGIETTRKKYSHNGDDMTT